jgi:hypothetical protein
MKPALLIACLVQACVFVACARAAEYIPSEAEKEVGARLEAAVVDKQKIDYLLEFVELKNARIAEAIEAREKSRLQAEEAVKRADALADKLAVEAAAVGVERGDASRKKALLNAAEKKVTILRSELLDTRKRLEHVQKHAENPSFGRWMGSRVAVVGAMAGDERAGRIFGDVLSGALDEAQRELDAFEGAVQMRTDVTILGLNLGRLIASFVCSLAVFLPLWGACILVGRMTRSVGFMQHLLIGHIFNATALAAVLVCITFTQQDPLVLIVSSPASKFVFCAFCIVQWTVMSLLIAHGIFNSYAIPAARQACMLHLAVYVFTIAHIRVLAYRNLRLLAEGGSGDSPNWRYYLGYTIAFGLLTALTTSTSSGKADGGLVRDVGEAIETGVSGVIGEAEKLINGSPNRPTSSRRFRASTSASRSQSSSSELPIRMDEVCIDESSKATP